MEFFLILILLPLLCLLQKQYSHNGRLRTVYGNNMEIFSWKFFICTPEPRPKWITALLSVWAQTGRYLQNHQVMG